MGLEISQKVKQVFPPFGGEGGGANQTDTTLGGCRIP